MAGSEQNCSRCGAEFHCGMGKPEECWCSADFVPLKRVPDRNSSCLCRRCLQKEIEAQFAGDAT
ncbi:MAG: cysteine-rich CWC family protein [Burkholderiales bacterium]